MTRTVSNDNCDSKVNSHLGIKLYYATWLTRQKKQISSCPDFRALCFFFPPFTMSSSQESAVPPPAYKSNVPDDIQVCYRYGYYVAMHHPYYLSQSALQCLDVKTDLAQVERVLCEAIDEVSNELHEISKDVSHYCLFI